VRIKRKLTNDRMKEIMVLYYQWYIPCNEPTAILFEGGLELSMLPTARQPICTG